VLVNTRNPLNVGAAARAMSNFGFSRMRVVNPYEPAFREARSAVGASQILVKAIHHTSVADAVADCALVVGTTTGRNRELPHALYTAEDAASRIRSQLRAGPVALLFGSEKFGLSAKDLNHCQWLLRIPTQPSHVSMNLGQAVAVCLYEIARHAELEPSKAVTQFASSGEIERVTQVLLEILEWSGYVKPRTKDSSADKTRRMIRRLNLSSEDAEVLVGMLRQISWKLKQ